MTGRILHSSDYRRMPWKNGGGTTTEIWKQASPSGETLWRLSIADVASDGPFSEFPGVDRWIMVIEGSGMVLDISGMGARRIDRPLDPLFFSGDAKTDCRLIDGPIRDFNFMIARSFGKGSLQVLKLSPGIATPLGENFAAIHVLRGSAEVETNDACGLSEGDTWIATQPHKAKVSTNREAVLASVSIDANPVMRA